MSGLNGDIIYCKIGENVGVIHGNLGFDS
jgi:hypothetical protein